MNRQGNVIYFSHGGGPLPILGNPGHRAMNAFMEQLPGRINRPDAVIVFSAHWEARIPTVIESEAPPLLYDYYGFPEEAYKLKYPARGNPELAKRIRTLLAAEGIDSGGENNRGFDHGLFIPLKMMYPEADIPMTQVSLVRGLNPKEHIRMGRALRNLCLENFLIIGSGFSFHNMQAFLTDGTISDDPANNDFQNWLVDTCTGNYTEQERASRLIEWEKAPNARYCHPREEHLLPLHVCTGLTGRPAELIFDDYILGKRAVAFGW